MPQLAELARRFDGAEVAPDRLRLTAEEIAAGAAQAGAELRAAIIRAAANIRRFHEGQRRQDLLQMDEDRQPPWIQVRAFAPGGGLCARRRRRFDAPDLHGIDEYHSGPGGAGSFHRRLHAAAGRRFGGARPAGRPGLPRHLRGLPGGRRAGRRGHGLRHRVDRTGGQDCRPGQPLRDRGQTAGLRPGWPGSAGRPERDRRHRRRIRGSPVYRRRSAGPGRARSGGRGLSPDAGPRPGGVGAAGNDRRPARSCRGRPSPRPAWRSMAGPL